MTPDETLLDGDFADTEIDASLSSVLRLTETGLPVDSGPDIMDMLSDSELARLVAAGR